VSVTYYDKETKKWVTLVCDGCEYCKGRHGCFGHEVQSKHRCPDEPNPCRCDEGVDKKRGK